MPVDRFEINGGAASPSAPPTAEKRRILIIDDEEIIRDSVSTYLEDSGFVVHQAKDGHEGLDRFRTLSPDVVLLDLRMPRMDGLEVLEAIAGELDQVPVIVVTGAGVLQDAVAALRLGAFDFVTKPIVDMAVLEHAVNRALEHSRLLEENRRYQAHLEDEIRSRTLDLRRRTEELLAANVELKKEVAIREKTAAALKQSEARLTEIVSIFEGFIYTCDLSFRLDFINRRLAEHVGDNVAGKKCHLTLYGLSELRRASPGRTTWGFHPRPHDAHASSVLRSSSAGEKEKKKPPLNCVSKGSDVRSHQTERTLVQLLLLFNYFGKGSDARPHQSERTLVQLLLLFKPRYSRLGKGSDTYQTRYRNTS